MPSNRHVFCCTPFWPLQYSAAVLNLSARCGRFSTVGKCAVNLDKLMRMINDLFRSFAITALAASLTCVVNAQWQLTASYPTDEGAIHLAWSSQPHELYQIQYADQLNTNWDGTTYWQVLYDNYPSHGTNTFWLDTGNYNLAPQVLHPRKLAGRFYRIMDLGPDTTSDEPWLSITNPTGGSVASGQLAVTVLAGTVQPVLSVVKLYVDGQEMPPADNILEYTDDTGVTNFQVATFYLNTCEWGNGAHVLFGTAECASGNGDVLNDSTPIATGHAVSGMVPVTFSNLITRISFTEPLFDPSSGQTQHVSAVFMANCNWTLSITDIGSNVVKTATGSGVAMGYDWDGTDNSNAILPGGVYFYYINAQTNGGPYPLLDGGSGGGDTNSPPVPSFASSSNGSVDAAELWAIAPGSDTAVPLIIYPPGFDTNGFTIFEASASEVRALSAPSSRTRMTLNGEGASADGATAASASSPAAPKRPPTNPVRGLAGTFGVCYDSFNGNGTNSIPVSPLDNGLNVHVYISMDGYAGGLTLVCAPVPAYKPEADNFISCMTHFGWQNTLLKYDSTLSMNDLKGSSAPINNVNLCVLMSHGAYGLGSTAVDFKANQCKQMYYPITSGASATYLRLSEMNLGGAGTNGLKWMAIIGCNSLQHNNWASMQGKGIKPYNSNLHLLLGSDTQQVAHYRLLWNWSTYMNYGNSTNYSPITVRNAWYQGAKDAYKGGKYGFTINYIVSGDTACFNDKIQTNATPQGSWRIDDPTQVYP